MKNPADVAKVLGRKGVKKTQVEVNKTSTKLTPVTTVQRERKVGPFKVKESHTAYTYTTIDDDIPIPLMSQEEQRAVIETLVNIDQFVEQLLASPITAHHRIGWMLAEIVDGKGKTSPLDLISTRPACEDVEEDHRDLWEMGPGEIKSMGLDPTDFDWYRDNNGSWHPLNRPKEVSE